MDNRSELFQISVSKDGMAVLLDCPAEPPDLTLVSQDIISELEALGVTPMPDKDWIEAFLEDAFDKSRVIKRAVLIRGQKPGKAIHGRVEWAGDFFSTGFVKDKTTGMVNYRKKAAQSSVEKDQLLGRQIPFQEGKEGLNVFGKTVPGEKAKVFYPTVGTNVRLDEDSDSYYATSGGRIRLLSDTLFVDKVITIEESVGLESGDLKHAGAIVVMEDIQEGSSVEADGDIEVHGVIEGANVKTMGNLIVRGGIMGTEDTKILVAGSIQAKFIINGDVESGRDIIVEREVLNTRINTLGSVIIPHGRIVGGRIAALRGISAGKVNTPASVHTELSVGANEGILDSLRKLKTKIERIEAQLSEDEILIMQFEQLEIENSDERDAKINEIRKRMKENEKNKATLKKRLKKNWLRIKDLAKKKIIIESKLYPETTVCLGSDKLVVNDPHSGPVNIMIVDGAIAIQSRTSTPATPAPA